MPTISLPCSSSDTSCRRGRPSPASVTARSDKATGPSGIGSTFGSGIGRPTINSASS